MKNYFLTLKKSFLILVVFILFITNGFSFITFADDTLFSIEGMNMSQYSGGGGSGDTLTLLQQLKDLGIIGGTGSGGSGGVNGGGDGTTFSYSEREVQAIQENSGAYINSLSEQINTLISGGYLNVDSVDLDDDGHEEIIATKDSTLYIYEWNGKMYKQSPFYTLNSLKPTTESSSRTVPRQIVFQRLEDEAGNSTYNLIHKKEGTNGYASRSSGCSRRTQYRVDSSLVPHEQSCGCESPGYNNNFCRLNFYAKGKAYTNLGNSYNWGNGSCHAPSSFECLYLGDGSNYGYENGKFYMKNSDGIKILYTLYSQSNTLGGYTVWRYRQEGSNGGAGGYNFSANTGTPFQNGNTIVNSEYDKFVKKANTDGTYNYKITLENPEGEQVIAFYGLNYNGIIFRDVNGDGVKDIMTFENYISEDNIKFKRVYIFLFNHETYTYQKVLDGVDALEYQWYDVDDNGNIDLLIRRYDEKLYMYKNNNLESDFENLGSIRGKYFLFKDLIHNGKHQIITKNMNNNDVAGEWKIYDLTLTGFRNATQNYENGLIGQNYKTYDIDGETNNLIGIKKDTDKYKVVYYNSISGLFENFPVEFYINDLTNSYILNGENGSVVFINKEGYYLPFYKNNENGKYYPTLIYRLSNGITLKSIEEANAGDSTTYFGETYYIAENKTDIQDKIGEGFDGGHIITTKVTDITNIFKNNTTFNDNINSWDTELITDLTGVFEGATSFNQSISGWNVSNVSNITNMFKGATSYNKNISNLVFFNGITTHTNTGYDTGTTSWVASNKPKLMTVLTKSNGITKYLPNISMTSGTYVINGTTYYVVSNVSEIVTLLQEDQNRGPYIITTKVTDMSNMFTTSPGACRNYPRRTSCRSGSGSSPRRVRNNRTPYWPASVNWQATWNGDISSWDTSNVTNMSQMFYTNGNFNQNISNWDVSKVTNCTNMFGGYVDGSCSVRPVITDANKPHFTKCTL